MEAMQTTHVLLQRALPRNRRRKKKRVQPCVVTGYRRSLREDNDAQLFAQSRTLRIRQLDGLDLSIDSSTSPLRPLQSYLWVIFMSFRCAGKTGKVV